MTHFARAFFGGWLKQVVEKRPALANFRTLSHEERVNEFRNLDLRVLKENRADLVGRLRNEVQTKLRAPAAAEALPFLRKEMAKQRHRITLRNTIKKAEAAIRAIKPCFLMSPLTVVSILTEMNRTSTL